MAMEERGEMPLTDIDGRTGVICIFLCFGVGLSNLFHVSIMILFGALCL